MNYKLRTNKAFTLIELVVAVALFAMVISFSSVIFKVSIEAYRTSSANAEIMQKLRAITDQLNRDFKGLQKDGYLMLYSEFVSKYEFKDSPSQEYFEAARIYYFTTGDFQSWFDPGIRSNIARVYFGHDSISLDPFNPNPIPISQWNLARDVELITPGIAPPTPPPFVDYNDISYAKRKADLKETRTNANNLLSSGIPIDIQNDPNSVRSLMCQNVGEIKIEWTDGTKYLLDNSLNWFGLVSGNSNYGNIIEVRGKAPPTYRASWTPAIPKKYWPKALKFTFTLYDSKGILEKGRTFTHIVYLGD
ncbi:MAG TPA: prepilin-type N-terminal cleavage/methylation domain-containing protein [Phycisphaerales bacterium]|nr:prepilin-type N-terminal cleavage/methylation domain-containing protein [Phycisphaerales bacterium]